MCHKSVCIDDCEQECTKLMNVFNVLQCVHNKCIALLTAMYCCTAFLDIVKVLHIWLYDYICIIVVTFSRFTSSHYSSFNQQMHTSVSWC